MKIFKIYRNKKDDISWDEYLGFVISAPDEDSARRIANDAADNPTYGHPSRVGEGHGLLIDNEYFDRKSFCINCKDYWENNSNTQITVEVISNDSNVEEGVVLSSYNAG